MKAAKPFRNKIKFREIIKLLTGAKKQRKSRILLVLLVTLTAFSGVYFYDGAVEKNSELVYRVVRVIDGDTIELEGGEKVRYIGIDTPENTTKTECFGKEATDKNKELVEGKKIRLEKDVSERDRYGRLLRYVYVGDLFINEYLIKEGYAYSASFPPDIKYQDMFKAGQKEAEKSGRGLWGGVCDGL